MRYRTWPLALALTCAACSYTSLEVVEGSGVKASDVRKLPQFERLLVSAPFDVEVRVGSEPEVVIEGDDNLLALVETELERDRLVIDVRDGYALRPRPRVIVVCPRLVEARIRGSGDVLVGEASGDVLLLSIQGSGTIRAQGSVRALRADIAGSGELRLADLAALEATIKIAGSGDVEVNASEELSISIAGSGDVRYVGDPRLRESIAGSGDVTRLAAHQH